MFMESPSLGYAPPPLRPGLSMGHQTIVGREARATVKTAWRGACVGSWRRTRWTQMVVSGINCHLNAC